MLDVLSAESCSSVVDEIIAKEGRLDILGTLSLPELEVTWLI